ncbi:alpha/beta hydrolase [Marinobacter nanhaiticus D15-8W]|uniref:Alpha/beta hydrolase n=1 Tax=Marinobacter nanhaiticus D15-8W TaxID=626887 RepID=N6WTR4_9GAMM|nr:alpha/beta hydrolase [Marinobacter nanhaiticus D15-8W]
MVLADWVNLARFNTLGGFKVAYWTAGKGEPLVLIHGFPASSWDWSKLWWPLAQSYRLIAMDLLGFGLSDKPWPHRYTIGEQAELILALLEAQGIDRFHVLAHDYGDTVTQELLARDLQGGERRIRSVALLNGGLFPEAHKPLFVQKLMASPLGPVTSRLMSRSAFGRNMTRIFGVDNPPDGIELDGFWHLIERGQGVRVMPGLIRYMAEREQNRSRWVGGLEGAICPLRFIDGVDDPISGEEMAKRYEAVVPNPDVLRIPGCGHYPQLEKPAEVFAAYQSFRKSQ